MLGGGSDGGIKEASARTSRSQREAHEDMIEKTAEEKVPVQIRDWEGHL
jgi:hypothetical protein